MLQSLGKYVIFISSFFRQMESFHVYVRRTLEEAYIVGYQSVFIFAVVSSFMGAVTAIQTAYNLVSPLIPRYVISILVRDTTILELSPTIMAIVFAGKIGSNIAGELGTMRITEQIDALEVMGVNSISYLVLPKVLACMIMYPLLVFIAMSLSILGGYIAGTVTGVITPTEYVYGLRFSFFPYNVLFAAIKSIVFAFCIASIAAFTGYYTEGGALEVGQASTKAVTTSCITILCGDYLLAELLL